MAVEEFGDKDTAPFSKAVVDAKTTLAQAFNVRQILDDAVPETPQQRRDLLTRVIVAAAKADQELDAQREAFAQLRDLIINAPTRLDAMTQQMVDLTARLEPSQQALTALHNQFADAALTSVAGNVDTAKQRLTFADQNITNARELLARPADRQIGLVDADPCGGVVAGSGAHAARRGRHRGHRYQPRDGRPARGDRRHPERHQGRGDSSRRAHRARRELGAARDAAVKAVADAQSTGTADPLGAFTKLTQADAELDRLLASVAEEREAAERLSRAYDQALFAAQSRVRAVSDYIDVRRGSIGPEARTRLAEAVRQLQAAQDKRRPIQRGDRARERRGDAGVAGAVDGHLRRSGRAARLHRALRQHRRIQYGRGARRHHPRQHPVRRDGRRHRRRHGRRLELDLIRRLRWGGGLGGGGGRF